MADLELLSPLQGWAAPLEETPDAVFAEKMIGDGVAVDPTGSELRAPCDGEIVSVHHTRHAVTLRADNGAEILMHIGIETVGLGGEGFEALVADGQRVRAGDPLLRFDLDRIAAKATSLVSPVIVANGEAFAVVSRKVGAAVHYGDVLMTIRGASTSGAASAAVGGAASRSVTSELPHGLHARPAAAVANCAKRFSADLELHAGARKANAKSVVALMALGVKRGEVLTVEARGGDAEAAVEAIAVLLGVDLAKTEKAQAAPAPTPLAVARSNDDPKVICGVTAAPGLAVGHALRFVPPEIELTRDGAGVALESAALARARAEVRERLESQAGSAERQGRSILAAHVALLDDPELTAAAQASIGEGRSAAFAWRESVRAQIAVLRGLGDALMAERAQDLADLERQVLIAIRGAGREAPLALEPGTILLADELLPSQLLALDASKLAGVCTRGGGPTSHVAILAAAMDMPAIAAAGERVLAIADGTRLILDADKGQLHIGPEAWEAQAVERALEARRRRRAKATASAKEPCVTADGRRIEVFANLGSISDAGAAVDAGAEGCGLLRTEFLFLEREAAPDEDEQARAYQAVLDGLGGRPLVIRTLDIGGDKPAPYLPLPFEENPALGLRGVRTSLWRPDLLETQLRAILRCKPLDEVSIMVPMVASAAELAAVRQALDAARKALNVKAKVKLGIMVETPASAVLADQLARTADFLSVGTNDLTQYALAMDRGNPRLAAYIDALHPAVLRLIGLAAEGGAKHKRWVGVCGGLASDPLAAPVLVGLGVTELSCAPARIAEVKAAVRETTFDQCRKAAARALELDSAQAVRAHLLETFPTLAGQEASA